MAPNLTPTIPTEMKAARITTYGAPYTLTTVPVPSPSSLGPHDLLVKVAAASHCHTDTIVRNGVFGTRLPCTGSHEGAGTVVLTGSSSSTAFRPGDRVMCGLPLHPCGVCAECTTGPENQRQYCTVVAGHVGVHLDGCFAEYVLVDARHTTPVPDGVSLLSAAPLACAGRTIWRGVKIAGLAEGEWLAIIGSGGGLGHIGVQFAKALGLRVVGVDARDGGLALTSEMGAEVVVDARQGRESVVEEVSRVTGGNGGVDAAIVLADSEDAAALACALTRMHGTVVQIAQPEEVRIPFQELVFRDIRIRGSVLCSPGESEEMMKFVAEHGIEVRTNVFRGLERIGELVDAVERGEVKGKAVVVVDEEQIRRERERGPGAA
ncbi:chaperonin 10-like protein [Cercophora scortea]|uniref:Chaperonin 10-like protein n=1 Tax=Cercophora scortea TaxID=314031 RepID=A0AAE0INE9_9PEZI|nr:chaperonin 10-like protein [Cercophora scortea]